LLNFNISGSMLLSAITSWYVTWYPFFS
jgi:hypothetical protein